MPAKPGPTATALSPRMCWASVKAGGGPSAGCRRNVVAGGVGCSSACSKALENLDHFINALAAEWKEVLRHLPSPGNLNESLIGLADIRH